MSDPRVCHHGGLRRQCEACDLAERLDAAVRLLREMLDKRPQWDMALTAAARALVESESQGRG